MKSIATAVTAVCLALPAVTDAQTAYTPIDFAALVDQLETMVGAADRDGFLNLLTPDADVGAAREFARERFPSGVSHAAVKPLFFVPGKDSSGRPGYELTLEVFTELGDRGRLQTWTLDVVENDTSSGSDEAVLPRWMITDHDAQPNVGGLYHLVLDTTRQFDAADLVIAGEDMTLRMSSGTMFVSRLGRGVTAVVLVGNGTMTFDPDPEAERGQVRLFSGHETLVAEFSHAFVRVNPATYAAHVSTAALREITVDHRDLRDAQQWFDEVAGLSYTVDLSELSDRRWWLNPSVGDFLAEVRTRRHGMLTYAQFANKPEDITLFQRQPTYRVIALYSSTRQRTKLGRYFRDADTVPYDILHYDIRASFEPRGASQESLLAPLRLRGCWIDGSTRLKVRVTGANIRTMVFRLSNDLEVRSVTSEELGTLPFLRIAGQNHVLVTLPTEAPIGTEFTIGVSYAGLLPGQEPGENWIIRTRDPFDTQNPLVAKTVFRGTPRYIYSRSSHWYPQSTVADYATATMSLSVPADHGVVASGSPGANNPPAAVFEGETGMRRYEFAALQPARYLSAIVSAFAPTDDERQEVVLARPTQPPIQSSARSDHVRLSVASTPRSLDRLTWHRERAADILRFYGLIVNDFPYPVFTLALTDSYLPGGHSPAYFAVLNQPLPMPGLPMSWRRDPVAFSQVDYFFLAHEIAHQWWGQAVGWKNYHEQWLSEALAQYFAALYVQHDRGDDAFEDVLSQLRRWAMRYSDRGPVHLGFRLGLIEGRPRVYRALVYNKGAMVLHMLRRLIGDDHFFGGLRRYYGEMRFRNAGTDDLIRAFETESGRSLEGFFDRWIHESDLPDLRFSYRTETTQGTSSVVLRFEQGPTVFDVPVTVTLTYRSGASDTVVVPVTGQITETRVELSRQLRDVEANADNAALVEIQR